MSTEMVSNFVFHQALQNQALDRRGDASAAKAGLRAARGRGQESQATSQTTAAVVVTISGAQGSDQAASTTDVSAIDFRHAFRAQRRVEMAQLGRALASGDLNAAQLAYDALVKLGQNGPFADGKPFHRADRAQAFDAIGQALQSGDLAGAQKAFQDLASTFGKHRWGAGGPLPPTPAPSPSGVGDRGPLPPTPAPAPSTTGVGDRGPLPPTPAPAPSTTGVGDRGPLPPTPAPAPSTTGLGDRGPLPPTPAPSTGGGAVTPSAIVINVGASEEVQITVGGGSGSGGQVTIDVEGQNGAKGEEVSINFNQGSNPYQIVLNFLSSPASEANGNQLSLQA